jgi:hypothetical protein
MEFFLKDTLKFDLLSKLSGENKIRIDEDLFSNKFVKKMLDYQTEKI